MFCALSLFISLTANQILNPTACLDSGWKYHQIKQWEKAEYFYTKSLEYEKDPTFIRGQALLNLASMKTNQRKLLESNKLNNDALKIFKLINHKTKQFFCLRNIGINYNALGSYAEAYRYMAKAYKLSLHLSDPELTYLSLVGLGRILEEMAQLEDALTYYRLARQTADQNSLPEYLNEVSLNIGNVFLLHEQYDSAEYYYSMSWQGAKQLNDSVQMGFAANNLGEMYLKIKHPTEAENYLLQAKHIKAQHTPANLALTLSNLASLYLLKKDILVATQYGEEALSSALAYQDIETTLHAYQVLVDIYSYQKQYKSALNAMKKLDSLRSYRFRVEKLEVSKQESKRVLEERNEQISFQESQLQQERTIRLGIITAALALLITSFVFYFLYRQNLKLKKRNELLLKEQNHRVKNNLQMISSLLSLQSQKLLSTDVKEALTDSQTRINSVALLHRMLYEGDELGKVDLKIYLTSLTEEIKYASPREVEIKLDIAELTMTVEKATSIGLIINELITNSIKHVTDDISLRIELLLKYKSENIITLHYNDNGQGVDQDIWNRSQSFGNQLIRIQSEQLRGTYNITSINGFNYSLSLSTQYL